MRTADPHTPDQPQPSSGLKDIGQAPLRGVGLHTLHQDDGRPERRRATFSVIGDSRDEVLERIRNEIRFRIELCPCSTVAEDYVELDAQDEPASAWRGSVF